ncbi:unnamed protein product [Caenorhabditis sp. 36 PRJEB53466]|nr:unnamed protein product [Caenorhabditis sp. 36 PRJEB53466]
MTSVVQNAIKKEKPRGEETKSEVESEPSEYSQTKSKSVMSAPSTDDTSLRHAYSVLLRVLMSGKAGEHTLTRAVPPDDVFSLLDTVKKVFMEQPVCLELDGPIQVCGDIHGQFSDLLRIFDKAGFPNRQNYLFLGDYVDRGKNSLETILLLFCYKIVIPKHFFLLRGNHECPMINKMYGFYDECQRRYRLTRVWEAFQDVFAHMPYTAIIGGRILCMHGGVGPKLTSLDMLRQFKRPQYQPETQSLEMDILWSDPSNFHKSWAPNTRGVSVVFGADALRRLLNNVDIDIVVRAHQCVQDGYEFFCGRRLVTLFSAPFYCGQFDNAAAVMLISARLVCSFKILRPRKKVSPRQETKDWRREWKE